MKKTILIVTSLLFLNLFVFAEEMTLTGTLLKSEKGEKIIYKVKQAEGKPVALKFKKKEKALLEAAEGLVDKQVTAVVDGSSDGKKIKVKKVISLNAK